jgi:endonuclease/exonuclease/phosphatase family metal-dependent hydrolase
VVIERNCRTSRLGRPVARAVDVGYHAAMSRRTPFAVVALLATALAVVVLAAQTPTDVRVVSYNIKHGLGNDDVVNLERTAGVLRALQPDIVGLQEVDDRATRSGGVPQAEWFGERLGLRHAFGKFMDFQGGGYGLAVLTRYPVVSSRSVELPEGNEPRVALAVEVRLPGDRPLTIVNVHFDWVRDDGFRYAQAEVLARFLDGLSTPYVLLGDFNDVPESRTLALFKTRAAEAIKPAGDRLTFSSTDPRREIDFIFYAPATAFTPVDVRVIDEPVASDHRPVLAVLRPRAG